MSEDSTKTTTGKGGMTLTPDQVLPWAALEDLVRSDPAGRGVASFLDQGNRLCPDHLSRAARDLADHAQVVAIVTGFCIQNANPPAAETDGPPGALFLARALRAAGIEALLITDRFALPALQLGCEYLGLPPELVHEFPLEEADASPTAGSNRTPHADRWIDDFLSSALGRRVSHLISIERVGPSHTETSLVAQRRDSAAPLHEFLALVPPEHRGVCHNIGGIPIDRYTAAIHRLFEVVAERKLSITTIGIGDGGNEIGMGAIPWEILRSAIHRGPSALVPCRIATDFTVLAGVSDWGAYALAFAVARLRGVCGLGNAWGAIELQALIERLVKEAGLVDGVSGQRQATVDGLPLTTYLQVFSRIRALCLAEESGPPSQAAKNG